MRMDAYTMFSNAQAIVASAASEHLPLKAARDIAVGTVIYLVMSVVAAFTDAGNDSTVTPKLQQDLDTAFGAPDDLITFGTFGALSAIGSRQIIPLQIGKLTKSFIRLYYTVANGDLSTGKITSFLTPDPDAWKAYPVAGGPSF